MARSLMMRLYFLGCCAGVGLTWNAQASDLAPEGYVSLSHPGISGLVELPTARQLDEGDFFVHLSASEPYSRLAVVFQPMPWLQGLFKYTDVSTALYGPAIAGDQTYKDKSFDLKMRLWPESGRFPELALGFNDIGGTGLFSSEYLVASKRLGRFDLTAGVIWGYQAGNGARVRDTGLGGTVDASVFFSGEAKPFAGLEYQFAQSPWVLKLEYDPNDYAQEPKSQPLNPKSPLNFGVVYTPWPGVDLQVSAVRGEELSASLTLRSNLKNDVLGKHEDPRPLTWNPTTRQLPLDQLALTDALKVQGFELVSLEDIERAWVVRVVNHAWMAPAKAQGRLLAVLNHYAPPRVETFYLSEQQQGLPAQWLAFEREGLDLALAQPLDTQMPRQRIEMMARLPSTPQAPVIRPQRPAFDWQWKPYFSGSFGGPDSFVLYQAGLSAQAQWRVSSRSWLSAEASLRLLDNYEDFDYTAPSNLPRVRTFIREYLVASRAKLGEVQFNHLSQIGDNQFVYLYGGALELMYAGVGAEWLYRPVHSHWALGVDVNRVRQRDFEDPFDLRDYEVTTGHASLYWQGPWDVRAKVSAGQYLAGDRGVTLDLAKRFANGAEMGVWATRTDATAEQFGEGSFDKGVYFRMPLDLIQRKSTPRAIDVRWRFLLRDGGARLNKSYDLYGLTQARDAWRQEKTHDQFFD